MPKSDDKKYYIAMWSGGKDSTFMILKLLENNCPLDEIIFCDTGWEFPQMYKYIQKVQIYINEKFSFKNITKLNWKKGKEIWNKWAETKFKKGRYKGLKRGFPFSFGKSWCIRELKINPIKRYLKEKCLNGKIYIYVGLSYEEKHRIAKINLFKNTQYLYPLIEWKIREKETNEYLKNINLYNNLYDYFDRLGCYICPKQSFKRLYTLYKYFPELWQDLYDLGKKYKEKGYAIYKIKGYDVDELSLIFKKRLEKEIKQLSFFRNVKTK